MKKFEHILGYSQEEMKDYLSSYLCATGYKVIADDGFLFAKGTIQVLLIAHMDTFGRQIPKTIIKEPTVDGVRIIAENSLVGGDDRCGIWMIMNIIKTVKCSVLFLEDEEIGCVGANKFIKTKHLDYVKDNISFMIELDRRGKNDCVFYSNGNQDFIKYIEEKTGTKEAYGSCSDISHLMPATNLSGVNISCGYYKEHTPDEYIMVDEMNDLMERVLTFLTTEKEFPKYEYKEKYRQTSYRQMSFGDLYGKDYFDKSYYGKYGYAKKPRSLQTKALDTIDELCLTVVLDDDYVEDFGFSSGEIEAHGKSAAECWATLFLENEDLCFSMITDYYFI